MTKPHKADIAIIGGGMGGVAAALAACQAGKRVILTEETDWLGGQMTSQGVSAFDEHPYIETFGGTSSYLQLREGIRARYANDGNIASGDQPLNPGNGWVSRLCFEPKVGLTVLEDKIKPYQETGQLTVLLNHTPVEAETNSDTVQSVIVQDQHGTKTTIQAAYFLDATELGDLLPLTNTPYVIGAEAQSDTGEDSALPEAIANQVQSFTYCFAVEYCSGEDHRIKKPVGYASFRDEQPYSLILEDKAGNPRVFHMFDGELPFWTYRRMRDGQQLGGNDVALINWHGNDYFGRNILDVSPEERAIALDEAKRLSLGFLYWLQTECPRHDGGQGYPELKLRPDVMGTADGLSKYPYIRESRRVVPLKRIVAQDITANYQPLARAANHPDSVGLGWYAMDLHPCVGNKKTHMYTTTKPFQIPLGALLSIKTRNLIMAGKNIGTSHLANGAYRLHPVEWAIGESAGALAAYCLESGHKPHIVWADDHLLWRFQHQLVQQGIPIFWTTDVCQSSPIFQTLQLLLVHGLLNPDSLAAQSLDIHPDDPIPAGTLQPDTIAHLHTLLGINEDELLEEDYPTWTDWCAFYHLRIGHLLS